MYAKICSKLGRKEEHSEAEDDHEVHFFHIKWSYYEAL